MKQRHLFRFETEAAICQAVSLLERDGLHEFETYSPYPLEFVFEAKVRLQNKTYPLDAGKTAHTLKPQKLAVAAFIGGLTGGILGYWLQYFTEVMEFPRMIADRPQHSWPAFMFVTFEMTVLGAALGVFYGFFIFTQLPRLNHPIFSVPNFDRASQDRFFLEVIGANDDPLILEFEKHAGASEVTRVALA